jgi:hypothetical protein
MTNADDGTLGGISLVTLDVDIEAELAAQYKVSAPPCPWPLWHRSGRYSNKN